MKVTLVKYIVTDFEIFKPLVCNNEIMKYISGTGWSENEAREKFDAILEINSKEDGLGYFKVFNDEHEYIGYCKLERHLHDNTMLEIGYILRKDFWRKGLGSLICQELLAIANELYPKLDLIGIIDPENLASKKILEKIGLERFFIGIEDGMPTEKLILRR